MPVYDPTQPLTGSDLFDAAQALTDLEIRPQVGLLQRGIDRNNRQGAAVQDNIGRYIGSFDQMAQQASADQQGISGRLNTTLAGIGTNAQDVIGAAGQTAIDQTRPMAELGLDGGATAQLAAEAAAQRGLAAQNAQSYQSFGANQGANYEGLTNLMQGVGALRGTEATRQMGNAFALANAEPAAQIAQLRGSRGDLMTQNVGALRDSERNFGLAVDTLLGDQEQAVLGARSDAADRRLRSRLARMSALVTMRGQDVQRMIANRRFLLDVSKLGWERAVAEYQRANGLGPYKPATPARGARRPRLTPGQRNTAWDNVTTAITTVQQLRDQGYDTRAIRQAFTNGYYRVEEEHENGDPVVRRFTVPRIDGGGYGTFANTAMDVAINGYISPANARALHRAGLRIGRRFRVQRRLPSGTAGPSRPTGVPLP